eukprot:TRINITY_DN13185_c0_g1_i1.p1 TRINITY_DN13185_c0_g1~~TRINITY_DN13185_c0_g1_i1.p1  ORF type:complete len:598 (+),score=138.05 TRINITY_DN13185_c0_g1_i1:64-1857(+)
MCIRDRRRVHGEDNIFLKQMIPLPSTPPQGQQQGTQALAMHPRLLQTVKDVKEIVAGSNHNYALTANGRVFAWGANEGGKLGLGDERPVISAPTCLESLTGREIDGLATGVDHSFAWSLRSGEVYAWGNGKHGKLGFGDEGARATPQLLGVFKEAITYGFKVVGMACGDQHSLALVETPDAKKLFVWGNGGHCQLGLDYTDDVPEPHQIDPDPWSTGLQALSARHTFSAVLTTGGEVFTWGSGEFGRLGYRTETKQQRLPRLVSDLRKVKVVKLALGSYHVAVADNLGLLYTWGRGINGQLGHGSIANEEAPRQVAALKDQQVVTVACGENHTVALTKAGFVCAWGAGAHGQLGLGDLLKQNVPVSIEALEGQQIIDLSCGRRHTLALTRLGRVYAWGSNESGQLGYDGDTPSFSGPTKAPGPFWSEEPTKMEVQPRGGAPWPEAETEQERPPLNRMTFSVPKTANVEEERAKHFDARGTIAKLMEENKLLTSRVRDLEQKSEFSMRELERLFEVASTYLQHLEKAQITPGNVPPDRLEVLRANDTIDKLLDEAKVKLDAVKGRQYVSALFAMQMLERFAGQLKLANHLLTSVSPKR